MAQPGSNYSTSGESTHYYHTYENQTYIFDQQNIAPISQFWWPQTTVAGYIPYANSANSCASFANNPHNIALWGNNPNGNNYNAQISTTTEWSSDFSAMSGWFGILPATTNSIVGSSGTSCGTQSVFDGFAAWMLGYNHTSGTMHDKANATAGFNMDGLRIDDISEQSPAFFTQLFHDIDNHSKSSNLYFGEYPTDSANNLAKFTSINTSSANSATGNTLRVLNFPLVAGLKQAFATGANLQESLTSMISGQYAYMSGNNGSLTGNNAINLVVDQDTVPDSIRTRDMCPATGNNEFVMNSYITPLAYGIILAMEAGTPFIYTDPQAEKGVGVDYEGKFVAKNSDGSVSYWNENEVIAGVYFHNQTLGKAMEWVNIDATSGTNIAALTRGDDYLFVVNKSSHDYATTHSHANMKNGCYIDLMSHQIINITNSTINQLVIPSQAVMYFVPYSGAVPSNAGFSC